MDVQRVHRLYEHADVVREHLAQHLINLPGFDLNLEFPAFYQTISLASKVNRGRRPRLSRRVPGCVTYAPVGACPVRRLDLWPRRPLPVAAMVGV